MLGGPSYEFSGLAAVGAAEAADAEHRVAPSREHGLLLLLLLQQPSDPPPAISFAPLRVRRSRLLRRCVQLRLPGVRRIVQYHDFVCQVDERGGAVIQYLLGSRGVRSDQAGVRDHFETVLLHSDVDMLVVGKDAALHIDDREGGRWSGSGAAAPRRWWRRAQARA